MLWEGRVMKSMIMVWGLLVVGGMSYGVLDDPLAHPRVLPLVLSEEILAELDLFPGDDAWLEISYCISPQGRELHREVGEKLWWIQNQAVLLLGSTGEPLPRCVLNRAMATAHIFWNGEEIPGSPFPLAPQTQAIKVGPGVAGIQEALAKRLVSMDATYLSEVANYLAQNLSALTEIVAGSYSVQSVGEVIDDTGRWVGNQVDVGTVAGNGVNVSQSGGDGLFVGQAGAPSGSDTSSTINGVEVAGAEGFGLYIGHSDLSGIYINQSLSDGIVVAEAGTPASSVWTTGHSGLEVNGAEGSGVFVGWAGGEGVAVHHAQYDGLHVREAGSPSTHISTDSKCGVEVQGAENFGVFVGYAGGTGVKVDTAELYGFKVDQVNEGDGLFVTTVGSPSTTPFQIGTTWDGLQIYAVEGNGVRIGHADDNGIRVESTSANGFRVQRAANHGVYVEEADACGVAIDAAGDPSTTETSSYSNGVAVSGAEGYGLFIGHSDLSGIRVSSTTYHGLYIVDSDDDAVRVNNTSGDGVCVSAADGYGVYANTTASGGNYGLYTPDNLYSANYHSKGAQMQVVQYQGEEDLLPGDPVVFAGILPPDGADSLPTVLVTQARGEDLQSIAGVAYRRYDAEAANAQDVAEGTRREKRALTPSGPIQPGDTLLVVTHGPALVNIDTETEELAVGDAIAVSPSGIVARADRDPWGKRAPDLCFATALQPLHDAAGQIWAFVTCH